MIFIIVVAQIHNLVACNTINRIQKPRIVQVQHTTCKKRAPLVPEYLPILPLVRTATLSKLIYPIRCLCYSSFLTPSILPTTFRTLRKLKIQQLFRVVYDHNYPGSGGALRNHEQVRHVTWQGLSHAIGRCYTQLEGSLDRWGA